MALARPHAADLAISAPEILRQLTHYESLPRDALRAAANCRAEMAPVFINEIDRFLAAGVDRGATPTPLFFIFHLLGDWRETSAYRPLARLLHCGSDDIDAAIGDAITMTSHRVMAAVFDGDPQPLYAIVLDPAADQFIRAGMLEALVMLAVDGRLPRPDVEGFLRACFTAIEPQGGNFVWHGWQWAVASLGIEDMTPLVREAFEKKIIDPDLTEFRFFQDDLQRALEHPDDPYDDPDRYALFGDTIEELSSWYGFTDQYERDRKRLARAKTASSFDEHQPVVNIFKKVGRNEPCPCGSGRKYKKCCLP
jgi:hypothetical protein